MPAPPAHLAVEGSKCWNDAWCHVYRSKGSFQLALILLISGVISACPRYVPSHFLATILNPGTILSVVAQSYSIRRRLKLRNAKKQFNLFFRAILNMLGSPHPIEAVHHIENVHACVVAMSPPLPLPRGHSWSVDAFLLTTSLRSPLSRACNKLMEFKEHNGSCIGKIHTVSFECRLGRT